MSHKVRVVRMAVGRSKLWEVERSLVDVAMGRAKADLVIKNGTLVNVFTKELLEGIDVAIKGDRIALVGKAEHTIGPETLVIDAGRKYLVPGLLDGHVHIESSMVTVTQFARAVLPHGTTAAFIDPHEIANVLGL
ncbi:MAG: adenine deaminase, partial [Thermoproteota archaeon]